MKRWFVLGLISGFMMFGGNNMIVSAEEIDVVESTDETLVDEPEEMVDFSETTVTEDTSETVIEYDSTTNQEIESDPKPVLRSRSLAENMISESYMPEDSSLEIQPRTILGKDDRYRVTNTTAFPNRAVGLIETTFPNGKTTFGTAAM